MVKCECLTSKGKPCKREAVEGLRYCSVHKRCEIGTSSKKETVTWPLNEEQNKFLDSRIGVLAGVIIRGHIKRLNKGGKKISNDTVALIGNIIIGAGSDLIIKEEMYRKEDKISDITVDNLIRAYRDIDDPYALTSHNERLMLQEFNVNMSRHYLREGLASYFMSFTKTGAMIPTSGPSVNFINLYLDTLIKQILDGAAKHTSRKSIEDTDILAALQ
jgi:hypothetical protein